MTRQIRNATETLTANQSCVVSEVKTSSKRVVLEICNMEAPGGADVFVSLDSEAATNKGRRIQPGQTITWSTDGGYIPPQLRVNAFSTANAILAVYEEIEV